MPKNVRVTLSLDEETRKILYEMATRRRQTMSQIVREAVKNYSEIPYRETSNKS